MKKFLFLIIFMLIFSPVTFAKQVLSGGQIETLALAEIEKALDERGEFRRREVNLMRSLTNLNLPEGIIDVKILLPSTAISYSTTTPVKARIFVNGKPYRDIPFMVSIKVFDLVLIANHDLRIETPVVESDFRIEEIAIDGRTEYLKDSKEINLSAQVRQLRLIIFSSLLQLKVDTLSRYFSNRAAYKLWLKALQ